MNTKQLREKFLSLAIEGKLVPQDASDEPAIELLKRISPKVQPLTEGVPFDVPNNWVWCKMKDVISLLSGRDLEKDKYYSNKKGIPYIIGATNFENGQLLVNRWTDKPATISQMGDLLITCKGTIGKMAFNNIGDIHIARQAMAISSHYINLRYIQAFLKCNIYSLETQAKSMIPGISRDTILNTSIPLPPLAEQKRIVERLEYIFSLIDTIEQAQDKMRETIKATRQKLLSLAVQGKLVLQDANDEPAIELLKRINPKLKPITEDVPFKVPESWCWVKGKQLFLPMESIKPQGNFIYIDVDAVNNRKHCIDKPKFLSKEKAPSRATRKLHYNDVLFSMVRPYLKNIALITEEFKDAIASTGFYVITPSFALLPKYLYYLMLSDYVVCGLNSFMKGDNSPSINNKHIEDFLFPLPPLAEQKRIVAKLENLFSTLDIIESNLN